MQIPRLSEEYICVLLVTRFNLSRVVSNWIHHCHQTMALCTHGYENIHTVYAPNRLKTWEILLRVKVFLPVTKWIPTWRDNNKIRNQDTSTPVTGYNGDWQYICQLMYFYQALSHFKSRWFSSINTKLVKYPLAICI